MLTFPTGVRLSLPYEIMSGPNKEALIEKIRDALIEQGYVIHTADSVFYKFYAEVNIDAPQIWSAFRSLCAALLPEKATPIVGEIDDEPLHTGRCRRVTDLLALFEPFEYYLANDCFIQFGLVAQLTTEFAEVFVAPTKHLQIWTNEIEVFKTVMDSYHIAPSEKLQLINEFPRVTTALNYENAFHNHEDFINHLVELTGEQ